MKSLFYLFSIILSVSSDGARSPIGVELVCDKANDCLTRCYIIFNPYNIFDPERDIYQDKYIACVKKVAGKQINCHDVKYVQQCFLNGEKDIIQESNANQEKHIIYWRKPN